MSIVWFGKGLLAWLMSYMGIQFFKEYKKTKRMACLIWCGVYIVGVLAVVFLE